MVPVLPAAGRPIAAAFGYPVPCVTTPARMLVTVSATPAVTARSQAGSGAMSTFWLLESLADRTYRGSQRMPCAASVA